MKRSKSFEPCSLVGCPLDRSNYIKVQYIRCNTRFISLITFNAENPDLNRIVCVTGGDNAVCHQVFINIEGKLGLFHLIVWASSNLVFINYQFCFPPHLFWQLVSIEECITASSSSSISSSSSTNNDNTLIALCLGLTLSSAAQTQSLSRGQRSNSHCVRGFMLAFRYASTYFFALHKGLSVNRFPVQEVLPVGCKIGNFKSQLLSLNWPERL
jgi:hypothetical protein